MPRSRAGVSPRVSSRTIRAFGCHARSSRPASGSSQRLSITTSSQADVGSVGGRDADQVLLEILEVDRRDRAALQRLGGAAQRGELVAFDVELQELDALDALVAKIAVEAHDRRLQRPGRVDVRAAGLLLGDVE